MKTWPRTVSSGFTLVELLVVIGIIGLLAALLLPALLAGRGKAHATSCISNLSQFGKGLQSYCSDFSGYFPCYPGYGIDPNRQDIGAVYYQAATSAGMQSVAMNNAIPPAAMSAANPDAPATGTADACGGGFEGVSLFRTCFFGTGNTGGLRAGPVGLGYLLTSGYAPDAKLLFCPSVTSMRPDYGALNAACSPGDLKTLGGNDFNSMTQGHWELLGNWLGQSNARGLQSHYSYRCVPTTYPDNTATANTTVIFSDVKPSITVTSGSPQFKTQKLLGERAIVADTFSKFADDDAPAAIKIGFGQYAHRDGYNVLYGDGHAVWVGDSAHEIMYWNQMQGFTYGTPNTAYDVNFAEVSAITASLGLVLVDRPSYQPCPFSLPFVGYVTDTEGFLIWHYLDTLQGIDK